MDWSGSGEIITTMTDRKCLICLMTTKQDALIRSCRCTGLVHSHCLLDYFEQVSTICKVCRQSMAQGLFTMTNEQESFDRGDAVYVRVVDEGLKLTRKREGSTYVIGICKHPTAPGARMPMFILVRQDTNY